MALTSGDKLGPYEILAPLGAGGMGEVYKARDTRLDRSVAVKVLPVHVSAQPDARQRFEREARAVSALNHPHICSLFDVGSQDGVDYIVMEHLEGETLEIRLRKGPLPCREALRLGVQIAEALGEAHAQGVVHRDLKPANIMVTRSGAKLLDFGLAKLNQSPVDVSEAASAETRTTALTGAGTILGTFYYMAPEQLEAANVDSRADIFSFGAVLYEMVTGRRSFQGNSPASLIAAIMSQDPEPVSSIHAAAPPALDRVVQRCLAKSPDDRWQNARDLADELRWISQSGSQTGAPAVQPAKPPISRTRLLAAALAGWLLFLAALIFTYRLWTGRPAPPPAVRFQISPPPDSSFPTQSTSAVSPDGESIVYVAEQGKKLGLWLRVLSSSQARFLEGTEGGAFPFWAPDGRKIGFTTGKTLYTLGLAGATPVEIFSNSKSNVGMGSWNSNGEILFYNEQTIWRINAAGGGARQVTELQPGEQGHYWPDFLPDGRRFIFLAIGLKGPVVFAGDLDSKERKEILRADGNARFAPPGHLVFSRGGQLTAQAFDPDALTLKGDAFPVPGAGSVAFVMNPAWFNLAAGPNGVLAWRGGIGTDLRELVWVDRKGNRLSTVGEPAEYSNPDISPDGLRLAIGKFDRAANGRDIWVFDLLRGTNSRLTVNPADDFNPAWSPDGRRIAFTSSRKGERDIYWRNSDGSGQDELVFESKDGQKNVESWSPDGRYMIHNFQEPHKPIKIRALPLSGERKPAMLIEGSFQVQQGRVSPDGRWLAYMSNETGEYQVYVTAFNPGGESSGKWQISTAGGTQPFWRADSKELFYTTPQALMAVDVQPAANSFKPGIPRVLFAAPLALDRRNRYVPAPDGQRFILLIPQQDSSIKPFEVLVNWTSLLKR